MSNFNLTTWALKHRQLIYYIMIVVFAFGILSYNSLGRLEDPDFVIREMVVMTYWPGATALEVEQQVTERIEKKLKETPGLDYLRSYSKPGESVVFVKLKDQVLDKNVRPTWLEVRNMVKDIRQTLPSGVLDSMFNDRFDDVFGTIYALTSDGFTMEEVRQKADDIRKTLLRVNGVSKVEMLGVQTERVYIDLDKRKIAQMGLDPSAIGAAINKQNAITPSGMIDGVTDNVFLRITGYYNDVESIKDTSITVEGRTIKIGDIAKVYRDYKEPSDPKMYFNGQPAIGVAVSMVKSGNILELGKSLDDAIAKIKQDLPVGIEISKVSDQPKVVKESINEFVKVLVEAIVIVLGVSFLSLGMRAGLVVMFSIPLVVAGLFLVMQQMAIDLHKISLGALIIALGLLVDDAIIAIESMMVKLEQGWDKDRAAAFAYDSTAMPRLTGAMVTCAGFIPVGFSQGSASEFVGSIFWVVVIALILSWLVAGTVVPILARGFIKIKKDQHKTDLYDTKFYIIYKRFLMWSLHHRVIILGCTIIVFMTSIFLMKFVPQEFFPSSARPEVIVDMRLPEGGSLKGSDEQAQKFMKFLDENKHVESYVTYVGRGSPRFILVASMTLNNDNFTEFIIVAKNKESRDLLQTEINTLLENDFADIKAQTKVLALGPPSPYPIMLRVSGTDHKVVREIAEQARQKLAENPHLTRIDFDWFEKTKVIQLELDQDKIKALGLDGQRIAYQLQTLLAGAEVTEYREGDKKISVCLRLDLKDRRSLDELKDISVFTGNGKYIPLEQIAQIKLATEEGVIWRRESKPTITVQADIKPGTSEVDISYEAYNSLAELRKNLPEGYSINIGGSTERSEESSAYIAKTIPVMLVVITFLLMLQLQNISKMGLVLLTAPLGIIGVSLGLLIFQKPIGFVVQLGILSLAGMIIRNAVILIDQIETRMNNGEDGYNAIIHAAVERFRPIMLTAAACILAMIPLASSVFWGPMAVAIGGGLLIATILTLIVFPVMYATSYKVKNQPYITPKADSRDPLNLN